MCPDTSVTHVPGLDRLAEFDPWTDAPPRCATMCNMRVRLMAIGLLATTAGYLATTSLVSTDEKTPARVDETDVISRSSGSGGESVAPTDVVIMERTVALTPQVDETTTPGNPQQQPGGDKVAVTTFGRLKAAVARGGSSLPEKPVAPSGPAEKQLFVETAVDQHISGLRHYSYDHLATRYRSTIPGHFGESQRILALRAIDSLCSADFAYRIEVMASVKQAILADEPTSQPRGKSDLFEAGHLYGSIVRPGENNASVMGVDYSINVSRNPRLLAAREVRRSAEVHLESILRLGAPETK